MGLSCQRKMALLMELVDHRVWVMTRRVIYGYVPGGTKSRSVLICPAHLHLSVKSAITVYINDPNKWTQFPNPYYGIFDVGTDNYCNAYVSNGGNGGEQIRSSVYHFRLIKRGVHEQDMWKMYVNKQLG